MLCIQFSVDSV